MSDATTAPGASAAEDSGPLWVRLVPRLIGAWILVGALFKLLEGTPAHLPEVVKDVSPVGQQLTYQVVIAIEFVLVVLAFFRPRWAWFWLAGCLSVFVAILVTQIASGVENCGCFGAQFSPPPAAMLAVDGALLVALLVSKPWATLPTRGANPIALAVLGLGLAAVPFLYSREATVIPAGDGGAENGEAPQRTNQYVILDVEQMVGQSVDETPFAKFCDPFVDLPIDGLWVVYRHTCEHCEEHLRVMAERELGTRMLGLIRLVERIDNDQNRVVHVLPAGAHVLQVELPDTVEYVIQTPAELLVEGGVVTAAKEGVKVDEGL